MGNSNLVRYTLISPNKTSRTGSVSKITIHHMGAVTTIEGCGNTFQKADGASTNYGVGGDGRIGLYVEEKDRAWSTTNGPNDHVAVNIEVANSSTGGNWPVSDTALNATIDLCVDICRRNGISSLTYTGNANGNLTLHKFFMATTCPGPYLESKMNEIASRVNTRLSECRSIAADVNSAAWTLYSLGIISTPAYWTENFQAIQYLGQLIINISRANPKSSPVNDISNPLSAIDRLYQRGIISTPDYWRQNYGRLTYLGDLLINVARRFTDGW